MLREIRPAIIILVLLTLITGLAYPLAMTAIAGAIFPKQAQGSLIDRDGKVVGSALIGQEFKDDKYFHGRPSATTAPDPADSDQDRARALQRSQFGRSNLGPTSKALNDRIKEDVDKLKAENPPAPFRSISSPRPAAASTRTSRRKVRCSRCRASPRRGICRRIGCASWWRKTPQAGLLGCSANPGLTYWRSIWRWTRLPQEAAPRPLGRTRPRTILPAWPSSSAAIPNNAPRRKPCWKRRGARTVRLAASRSSSAPLPASARPTRCCKARTPGGRPASMSSSARSRPTDGRRPKRCCRGSKSSRANASCTGIRRSRRWTSTR